MDIDAKGFVELGRALRDAGNKDLNKRLRKGIREAGKPIIAAQRRNVRGLAGAPSEWKTSASRRTRIAINNRSKKRAGIRILTTPARGSEGGPFARYMNRGKWRHPVFGDRERWVTQTVSKGWFDGPAEAADMVVTPKLRRVLAEVVDEIARRTNT